MAEGELFERANFWPRIGPGQSQRYRAQWRRPDRNGNVGPWRTQRGTVQILAQPDPEPEYSHVWQQEPGPWAGRRNFLVRGRKIFDEATDYLSKRPGGALGTPPGVGWGRIFQEWRPPLDHFHPNAECSMPWNMDWGRP